MKNNLPLDARLSLAASFTRGGCVCDVGTDHAYIPISLLLSDKATAAIATDINEGPLANARRNAADFGVSDKITFCLADGLSGVPLKEHDVRDIVICGMGGELIASIIEKSEYVFNPDVRLILQPMTKPEALRKYLSEAGFETVDEALCTSGGKIYQCIVCSYCKKAAALSPAEKLVGKINISRGGTTLTELILQNIRRLRHEISGKSAGGLNTNEDEALLSELIGIVRDIK